MKKYQEHFEDQWNTAESLVTTESAEIHCEKINNALIDLQSDPFNKLGIVLLNVSALSKIYNINVAAALIAQLEDLKVEKLE